MLAIVMLTGCKEPTGLPNVRVHAATVGVDTCFVGSASNLSGRVEQSVDGGMPYSYTIYNGVIRREFEETGGLPDPKTYGFCVFQVPDFSSPNGVPVCSLFYYQTSRSGSLDLALKWLPNVGAWQPSASVLYKAIDTSGCALAPTQSAQENGWRALELSNQGSAWLEDCAGGSLVTGWKHTNAQDGWRTDVTGVDPTYAPFIKIVYYPD